MRKTTDPREVLARAVFVWCLLTETKIGTTRHTCDGLPADHDIRLPLLVEPCLELSVLLGLVRNLPLQLQ